MPGRRAHVVLQHQEAPVRVAHEVQPRDGDACASDRREPDQVALEVRRAVDHALRDDPVRDRRCGRRTCRRANAPARAPAGRSRRPPGPTPPAAGSAAPGRRGTRDPPRRRTAPRAPPRVDWPHGSGRRAPAHPDPPSGFPLSPPSATRTPERQKDTSSGSGSRRTPPSRLWKRTWSARAASAFQSTSCGGPRQRLLAGVPGAAEADPHRRPRGREVPLPLLPHDHLPADLERRAGAVGADRRGAHRPDAEVERHQLELQVGENRWVDQHGRHVLVRQTSHAGNANPPHPRLSAVSPSISRRSSVDGSADLGSRGPSRRAAGEQAAAEEGALQRAVAVHAAAAEAGHLAGRVQPGERRRRPRAAPGPTRSVSQAAEGLAGQDVAAGPRSAGPPSGRAAGAGTATRISLSPR